MVLIAILVVFGGIALAVANGANDNGKPVATLIGSGAFSTACGVRLSTIATLLGALSAAWWGLALLKAFGGQGLVAPAAAAAAGFLPTVAIAAAGTIALATWLGLPVSTTHALLGGLVGAGLVIGQGEIAWSVLGATLIGPLLLSPVLALILTMIVVVPLRWLAGRPPSGPPGPASAASPPAAASTADGLPPAATPAIPGALPPAHLSARGRIVRALHVSSALAVSFARGLNDTPKIAAVLLAVAGLGETAAVMLVAVAMAGGGWFLAQRVTITMSHKLASLDGREPDALAGCLSTAFLVIAASRWGVPASTTHVMTGAIVGAGAARGEFKLGMLGKIVLAWVTTLPLAAGLAAILALLLR